MTTATHNYGWLMPDPGGSANTWGNTLNGTTQAIDSQMAVIGNQVQSNALVVSRGPDGGNYGIVDFMNYGGAQSRWQMGVTSETEGGGSNTGSNFILNAIDNSGAYLGTAFEVDRASQNVTFTSGTVSSQAKAGGNAIFELKNSSGANMGYLGWNSNIVVLTNTNGNGVLSISTDGSVNTNGVFNANGGIINNWALSGSNPNYYFLRNDGTSMGVAYYDIAATTLVLKNQIGGGVAEIDPAGSFRITGQAFKPGGGAWLDTSDARIKTVTGAYSSGLDQVVRLNPVTFTYKGNDGDAHALVAGKEFVGLVADEAMQVMPEMVSLGDGEIDGGKVSDLKTLDPTALIYALVNAVKELKAEIEALKAGR